MIIVLTGPEGSGKTSMMTYLALQHAAAGLPVLTFPGYDLWWKGIKISRTIRVEDWIAMDESAYNLFHNSLLCIDEMQNHFDRMSYTDVKSRLFASGVGAQRRKMNMGIIFTIQDIDWGYGRLAWLAHVHGECYDLFWSPWGKQEGLERGELLRVTFTDMKGFFTGEPYTQMASILLRGKPLREAFRSFNITSVYENIAKVKIKRPELHLSFGEQMSPEQNEEPTEALGTLEPNQSIMNSEEPTEALGTLEPNQSIMNSLKEAIGRAEHD